MRGSIRTALVALTLALSALTMAATRASAEVVDRILAVVGREVIMLSDAYAALRFGFAPPVGQGEDPVRVALDSLISRQLELSEANRYGPPEPPAQALDARLDEIRGRFKDQQAYDAMLSRSGLTLDQLRLRVRDDMRIEAYLDQRFGSMVQPRDEDLIAYYRGNEAAFTVGGVLKPFAEVRAEIRDRISAERRAVVIREWVEGLRRRSEVNDLYLTPKPLPPSGA